MTKENEQGNKGYGADISDVITAVFVSVMLYGGLLWYVSQYTGTRPFLILCGIIGAALGWVCGILISPYTKAESADFSKFSKLIYGFLTGYLVSKIDPLVNRLTGQNGPVNSEILIPAAFAFATFLITIPLTYITRRYSSGAGTNEKGGHG